MRPSVDGQADGRHQACYRADFDECSTKYGHVVQIPETFVKSAAWERASMVGPMVDGRADGRHQACDRASMVGQMVAIMACDRADFDECSTKYCNFEL